MIIFGGVDGTGVWNNDKYAKMFEYSFVRILYNGWTAGPRNYERGPVIADNKPRDYTYFSTLRTYRHVLSNRTYAKRILREGFLSCWMMNRPDFPGGSNF